MVFSDQAFLFLFLPLSLLVGLPAVRTRWSSAVILCLSLCFFFWGSGEYVLLLLGSILLNYSGGLAIARQRRRWRLILVIALNVILLAYFKYCYFFLDAVSFFGNASLRAFASGIVLPIGVSFYTFQGISYVVDVWRGEAEAERNPIVFSAYLSFFPQLIAGPIVRYRDVAADFHAPALSFELFAAGVSRFVVGLSKKVLIADVMSRVADAAFSTQGPDLGFLGAWLGAIAYSIQIYFDFSGYSDMAIGLGMMFGVRFRENFNHPYAASTLTQFWRRWHISLSTWFRDYLYIPLGGNRVSHGRTMTNLAIVFVITGLWHGAAWTFVLWGLWHGLFLTVERLWLRGTVTQYSSAWARLLYFGPTVIFGWVLFRATSLTHFLEYSGAMLSVFSPDALSLPGALATELQPVTWLVGCIALGSIIRQGVSQPLGQVLGRIETTQTERLARTAFVGAALALCAINLLPRDFSPFLYFRF